MESENIETMRALIRKIKSIQMECVDTCNVVANMPPESFTPQEVKQSALGYVQGLAAQIENSETPVPTDENLLTAQFLNELKERTAQVKELVAFKRGAIRDTEAEIARVKGLIQVAQEARSKGLEKPKKVEARHLEMAKDKFRQIKNELYRLIQSMFPDKSLPMFEVLGQLMANHMSNPDGYIEVTKENCQLIETLKEHNVVSMNPHNNKEVKLAYLG